MHEWGDRHHNDKHIVDDFDAEWDSIKTPVMQSVSNDADSSSDTEANNESSASSASASASKAVRVRSKKKAKKPVKPPKPASIVKANSAAKASVGGVSSIYSADKTGHVIEYGIQHDKIRAQREEVKRIKDKRRRRALQPEPQSQCSMFCAQHRPDARREPHRWLRNGSNAQCARGKCAHLSRKHQGLSPA